MELVRNVIQRRSLLENSKFKYSQVIGYIERAQAGDPVASP
jgi:hypothetical protein